jgi:hypothetical protein
MKQTYTFLGLSAEELRQVVREGKLRYFYKIGDEYKFHNASLEDNRLILSNQNLN